MLQLILFFNPEIRKFIFTIKGKILKKTIHLRTIVTSLVLLNVSKSDLLFITPYKTRRKIDKRCECDSSICG